MKLTNQEETQCIGLNVYSNQFRLKNQQFPEITVFDSTID